MFDDFYIRIIHASDTAVHFTWFIPEMIQKIHPDYYCIVYNTNSVWIKANGKQVRVLLNYYIFETDHVIRHSILVSEWINTKP